MTDSTVPHVRPVKPPPGRVRYLVALVIFLIGMGGMIFVLFRGLSGMDAALVQVVVPGEKHMTLEPGKYTIFHERHSVVDGRIYDAASLGGLAVAVASSDGQEVSLTPASVNSTYSFGSRTGVSAFEFTVASDGDYVVSGSYPGGSGPDTVIAVGKGFLSSLIGTIFGSLAFAFVGSGIALFLALSTLFRRRRAGHAF